MKISFCLKDDHVGRVCGVVDMTVIIMPVDAAIAVAHLLALAVHEKVDRALQPSVQETLPAERRRNARESRVCPSRVLQCREDGDL